MGMIEVTRKMKSDSYKMASLSIETRNNILKNVREALIKNQQVIFAANKTDMENAEKNNIADSVKKDRKSVV